MYATQQQEENKDKPKEEREKMGRIRDIVAQMLNTSTTQVGRMEAIENNLSQEFKDELEKGNINISTAHELSRLDKDGQKQAYEKYEEKGELHISDVKEEPKTEITDEQAEQVQKAIKEALKGEVNRAVFKVKGNVAERGTKGYYDRIRKRKYLPGRMGKQINQRLICMGNEQNSRVSEVFTGLGGVYEPYRIQGGYYLVRRRKGKQSIIYIGCLPIRTNWKNRKRNVRFNKSMYAIL